MTAETVAKTLEATIEWRRECAVAKFKDYINMRVFFAWLLKRDYILLDTGSSALCVAYTPPAVTLRRRRMKFGL